MKLKFCGLTRIEDIEAANETRPDYIGFVFADSRRHVSDLDAARLKEHLDPEIKTVGVCVNDEPEHIRRSPPQKPSLSACRSAALPRFRGRP